MISKKNAQKWIDALRSGEYKQTQGALQNNAGYCCMGVACKIFIPKGKQLMDEYGRFLLGGVTDSQPNCPKWLYQINDNLHQKMGHGFIGLNDNLNFTFDEIADCIQAVYIEGALDEETK